MIIRIINPNPIKRKSPLGFLLLGGFSLKGKTMAYTPELSQQHSGILRRIAWAFEIPMKKAIEGLLECSARFIDHKKVCGACRDKSFCMDCVFKDHRKSV